MLTLFTTAKPFRGHIAIIQRNALQSWKRLDPGVEIIVFGDDEGSAEMCREFGLRYEPHVARTSGGAIRLDDMFQRAQALARHDLLCYANCDILLQSDFCCALKRAAQARPEFLMVGRRWDLDITEPIDFSNPDWQQQIRGRTLATNRQRNAGWIDYFAFTRGLYGADLLPLAIGRVCWDVWLVWKALAQNKTVIDASRAVMAIHQNHDYNHHPQGAPGIWGGEEAKRNFQISGGLKHFRGIADATDLLDAEGIRANPFRRWSELRGSIFRFTHFLQHKVWNPVWFAALDVTRPLRTVLGLRSQRIRHLWEKS